LPLDQVAEIKITEGPAAIKGENGLLRNYVRLNVRDRDPLQFAAETQRIVAERVSLPTGVLVEWTGQFEPRGVRLLRAREGPHRAARACGDAAR